MATEIRAEVEIDAAPSEVWSILADLDGYSAWNPFTPRVEGQMVDGRLRLGDAVVLHVAMKPGKRLLRQVEHISAFDPGRELGWGTKMMGGYALAADRRQVLEPLPGGRTRYVTWDRFEGPLVPLVMALYRADIQRGFDALALGLKRHAEARRGAVVEVDPSTGSP